MVRYVPLNSSFALTTSVGSLVRVGPNELVTDDPDVMRRMMAVRSAYTRGHCEAKSA